MKNTFKVVLINAVTCAAVLNNCGYTNPPKQMTVNDMSPAPMLYNKNNMINFFPQQNVANHIMKNNINNLPSKSKIIANPKNQYERSLNNINGNVVTHTCGLENVGATCYMNATLQCLLNLNNFSKPLMQLVNTGYGTNNKVAVELAKVAAHLWSGKGKHFAPNAFKKVLGEYNELFQGVQANDAKDLILYIFETLHCVFNMPKGLPLSNTGNAAFDMFFNNYFPENNSFISNSFYNVTRNDLSCTHCKHNKISYNIANCMISPLEKIRQMKANNGDNSPVTLEDCFAAYSQPELLTGANQIYCNDCCRYSDAMTRNTMYSAPNILTLILNRGKGLEFNVPTNFGKETWIYEQASNKWVQYKLKSFITHIGESGMSGHFVANVKCKDGKWRLYNDSIVTEKSDKDITASLSNTTGQNNSVPYVLFFERVQGSEKSYNPNNNMSNMQMNGNLNQFSAMKMQQMLFYYMMLNNMNNMLLNNMGNMNWNMGNAMNMNNNMLNNIIPVNNMMQNMNYNNNMNYNCNNNNCMHQHNMNITPINYNNGQNPMLNNANFIQQNNNGMNMNGMNAMNMNFANNNNNLNNMNKFSNNIQNNNVNYNNNMNAINMNYNNNQSFNNNRMNRFSNNNFNNNNGNNNGRSNSAPNMNHFNNNNFNQMNMGQMNNQMMQNNLAYNNMNNINNNKQNQIMNGMNPVNMNNNMNQGNMSNNNMNGNKMSNGMNIGSNKINNNNNMNNNSKIKNINGMGFS